MFSSNMDSPVCVCIAVLLSICFLPSCKSFAFPRTMAKVFRPHRSSSLTTITSSSLFSRIKEQNIFTLKMYPETSYGSLQRVGKSSVMDGEVLPTAEVTIRESDWLQNRDLEEILNERARRFYASNDNISDNGKLREHCVLVTVDRTTTGPTVVSGSPNVPKFSCEESLEELSELVGTAGLIVAGCVVQRLPHPNSHSYIGSGKIEELAEIIKTYADDGLVSTTAGEETEVRRPRGIVEIEGGITVVVVDDDLSPKQQRALEDGLQSYGVSENVKVLDRTAIILEIFPQHAQSKEGQMQVELAMLQYRLMVVILD